MKDGFFQLRHYFSREDAFALTSMLFLITILSCIAASVITLQYLRRQLVIIDVAKVKAEYAAESGITKASHQVQVLPDSTSQGINQHWAFNDGSAVDVVTKPWGMYYLVSAEGRWRNFSTKRVALIADHPASQFKNALYYANPSHQLVFTGTSSIQGDVVVGQPGTTIGNLRNYSTPMKVPVKGDIQKEKSPELPVLLAPQLKQQASFFDDLLVGSKVDRGDSSNTIVLSSDQTTLTTNMLKDSTKYIIALGDIVADISVNRNDVPLYIIGRGKVVIKNSHLQGLISVLSLKDVIIEKEATLDEAIIFSKKSIDVSEGAAISAQLFAPSITLEPNVIARYPSVLAAINFSSSDTTNLNVHLRDNSRVEGTVILLAGTDINSSQNLITIEPTASVVGMIYSNTRILLDGAIIGTVVTKDFYFYESPTTYLGWLRSGTIDRSKLPVSFLMPPGFDKQPQMDVLDWL